MIHLIPAEELRALYQLIGRNIAGELPLPFEPAARIRTRPETPGADVAAPGRPRPTDADTEHDVPSADVSITPVPPKSAALMLVGLRAPLAAAADISSPERPRMPDGRIPAWPIATAMQHEGAPMLPPGPHRAQGAGSPASHPRTAADAPGAALSMERAVGWSDKTSPADGTLRDGTHRSALGRVAGASSRGEALPGEVVADSASLATRRPGETHLTFLQVQQAEMTSGEGGIASVLAQDASPAAGERDEMRWLSAIVSAVATGESWTAEAMRDAGGRAEQQSERAGVIASFILNAAMLPGWPPPRPFEPVADARQVTALGQILSELSPEESDLGERLLRLLRNPALLERLLRRLLPASRRARLLAALTLVLTRLAALLELIEQMTAEADDDALRGGSRTHLRLR